MEEPLLGTADLILKSTGVAGAGSLQGAGAGDVRALAEGGTQVGDSNGEPLKAL